jgi:hypothetical protein
MVVTANKIIFTVVFTRCITNRCTGIYKFGNKYLPSVYKMQFEFRSHFSGEKVCLIGWEIQYMELLVKPEILKSYMYGPTFGNAESRLFLLLHNVSTLNQCRKFSCVTVVCEHFASYQDYPNYKMDLIR